MVETSTSEPSGLSATSVGTPKPSTVKSTECATTALVAVSKIATREEPSTM
ncbi:hypothetical protein [Microbacterium sp. SORGH_AS_0862]|uniref:hypothetical protein n=1 Tax=Microbacterium sp. SORGH_AS_0862 TaxID=3041789 RepID=UPI0035930BFA